jgi:hypothetical protein
MEIKLELIVPIAKPVVYIFGYIVSILNSSNPCLDK